MNELSSKWVAYAVSDLENARVLLEHGRGSKTYDTVCYLCQQSIEKYLKAVLTEHRIAFKKTHSLVYLIDLLKDVLPEFEFHLGSINILDTYSISTRYPGEDPVSRKNSFRCHSACT
jgi:HEPN domain-containing protein